VNTVAPAAPTAQLTGGITLTNNNEPPMNGTAAANSTVTVYVDGAAIGTTTANASGNWSYTPSSPIANGAHILTATATDAYGNVSVPSAGYNFSVNTVAPAAPTAQLTGGITLTNNNEPPMSGTAAANSTVTVYVDGTSIGTTIATAGGAWSFAPTTALSNGAHALTATATDAYGNVSQPSAGYNFSVNTVAPAAPTAQLTSGSSLTNNNEPPMSGTAQANSTVTVYVDGVAIGTTTANASGNWSYTPTSPISNGAHTLTATATDAYGNVSAPSAAFNFSVNTTAPAAPTAQLTSGATQTNNNEPPMSGTAQANSTVTIYVDGAAIGTTTANASGNWSYTPISPIANGAHALTATATDAYGNVSAPSAAFNFSVNTTAPAAPTAQLTSGATQTNNNEPPMSGTAQANSTVTIYVDGAAIGTTTANASGNWSYTPTSPISNGAHTLTATATDAYGNVSVPSASYNFSVNTVAPAAPTVQLASGSNPTNNNEPPLKGTAQPNSTVTIYVDGVAVGTTIADASGNWTYTPTSPIANGTHSITATATDGAGNVSPVSQALSVTISTTAPAIPSAPVLVGGNNGNINTTTPTITGNAVPGDTVTIYVNGVAVGTTIASSSGTYTYTFNPALGQGTQWVTVAETDPAGNTSGQSSATRIVVNTTAPLLTLGAQTEHDSQPFPVTFIFSEPITSFDTSLILLKNGTLSNLTEVNPGVYTAIISPITDSTVVISVAQGAGVDSAGNTSLASNVLVIRPVVTGVEMVSAVYPIPASTLLNIKFSGVIDPDGEVMLVSMDGKYVLKQQVSFQGQIVTLNVSNLASAAYVLIIKANHLKYTRVIEIAR
jgi:hypothetical protein